VRGREQGESFAQILDSSGAVVDATPGVGTQRLLAGRQLPDEAGETVIIDREAILGEDGATLEEQRSRDLIHQRWPGPSLRCACCCDWQAGESLATRHAHGPLIPTRDSRPDHRADRSWSARLARVGGRQIERLGQLGSRGALQDAATARDRHRRLLGVDAQLLLQDLLDRVGLFAASAASSASGWPSGSGRWRNT